MQNYLCTQGKGTKYILHIQKKLQIVWEVKGKKKHLKTTLKILLLKMKR